jgi:hypothetical protein
MLFIGLKCSAQPIDFIGFQSWRFVVEGLSFGIAWAFQFHYAVKSLLAKNETTEFWRPRMAFVFEQQYSRDVERAMSVFFETLSEKDRRRYIAVESQKLGFGGIKYLASVVGCSRRTIEHGRVELKTLPNEETEDRIRRSGGGRKRATENEPMLVENFF